MSSHMSSRRSIAAGVLVMTIAASAAYAQTSPTTMRVDVSPTAELLPGSLVRVTYRVTVLAPGRDSLFEFSVDAPSPATRVVRPEPPESWAAFTAFGTQSVASWSALDLVGPGQSTPALVFEAVGLPDFVRYSALRYSEPLDDVTDDPPDAPERTSTGAQIFDPGTPNRVVGFTLGVVPPPANVSPPALASRLASLIDRACELGWVDNAGVCTSLRVKAVPEAGPLGALLQELDAQRGQHVSEAGYALLKANAQYLAGRL